MDEQIKDGAVVAESDENGFGPDFIEIEDEDGNTYQLEHLDTLELGGVTYMAFCEADETDDPEVIIFRVVEENGEEMFATIDDDDEMERVFQEFHNVWLEQEQ